MFGGEGVKTNPEEDERILWMDFSLPSDRRTSFTSAEMATWEPRTRLINESTANKRTKTNRSLQWSKHLNTHMYKASPCAGSPLPPLFPAIFLSIFTPFLCLHYFNHSIKSVNTFIIVASSGGCYLAITLFSNCIVTGDDGKRRAFSFDAGCLSGRAITPFAAVTLHSARQACLMPFI